MKQREEKITYSKILLGDWYQRSDHRTGNSAFLLPRAILVEQGIERGGKFDKKSNAWMGGDCKVRLINSDLVFPTSHGTPIRDNNIERAFRLALKEAAVMDFRFHDLRHTAATRMVQNGIDLYKVQLILGHKGPQMTQRYAHHYPESLRSAVDTLEKVSQICHNGADQPNNQSYNILKSQHMGQ